MPETLTLESPFKAYPGQVTIPTRLDAKQFNEWWEKASDIEQDEDDYRHGVFQIWEARFHLILENTVKIPKGYEFEPTGLKLPDPAIALWFKEQTQFLVDEALNIKN